MSARTRVEVNRHRVGPDEVALWLAARHDVVVEHPGVTGPDGTTTFALDRGPATTWDRTVTTTPDPAAGLQGMMVPPGGTP